MKDYWKHFANDYWTNKLCWKVQKAKNYDKKSIRQWCHLLKITKISYPIMCQRIEKSI